MFDILGIDWGLKRFGLAFAESGSKLIIAANYPCPAQAIWKILDEEISTREVQTVVVGRPVNFQGQDTLITNQVDAFVSELENKYPTLKVTVVNERGSSKQFSDQDVNKQQLNHLAATRIIEYYFGIERG
jgi:putative Holliday junction resolvase